ncbi:MAG: hypothetical protein KAZ30_01090 [Candidatus Magasanikbacteria bacterium]|nr:hypothetical protein [Candidatus Magasanikbacteria bacterium]
MRISLLSLLLTLSFVSGCARQVYIHELQLARNCLDVTNEIYDVGNIFAEATPICDETMPERLNIRLAEVIRMGVEYGCDISLKDREMRWAIAHFQQWEQRCMIEDALKNEEDQAQ